VWEAGYFNDRDRSFHEMFDSHLDDLLTAFARGAEPPIHARDGRRALQIALACIESYESGKRILTP
jgi:predicted dehydrogenase